MAEVANGEVSMSEQKKLDDGGFMVLLLVGALVLLVLAGGGAAWYVYRLSVIERSRAAVQQIAREATAKRATEAAKAATLTQLRLPRLPPPNRPNRISQASGAPSQVVRNCAAATSCQPSACEQGKDAGCNRSRPRPSSGAAGQSLPGLSR
jgi:hypothetical protein